MLAGTFNLSAHHVLPMNSGTYMSLKCLSGAQALFNPGGLTGTNHYKFTEVVPPKTASGPGDTSTSPSP